MEQQGANTDLRSRAEQVLRSGGVAWDSLQPHTGGAQHQLYKVARAGSPQRLLKVPKVACVAPDRSCWEGLQAEAEAMRLLRDVAAPRPYQLLEGGALMAHVPGQSAEYMYSQGRLSVEALSQVCFEMGKQLAAIHSHRMPADYAGPIPVLAGDFGGPMRLVHGDFHLGNVQLVMDRRRSNTWLVSGVVDWVNCSWGPAEWDFVELHLSVFRQLQGSREAFLGGYRAGGALAPKRAREQQLLAAELKRRLEADEVPEGQKGEWVRWLAELP